MITHTQRRRVRQDPPRIVGPITCPFVPAPFLVVLPFWEGDARLALKLVKWLEQLGRVPNECLLVHDTTTAEQWSLAVELAAERVFAGGVSTLVVDPPEDRAWPLGQNNVWMQTSRFVAGNYRQPWLWLETDCAPVHTGWLARLEAEYDRHGKPFAGYWIDEYRLMNGQGIYPWNVGEFSLRAQDLLQTMPKTPWDAAIGPEIEPYVARFNELIVNIWLQDPEGRAVLTGGEVPTFPTQAFLDQVMTPETAIVHRCKDGTLIDRLRERRAG